MFSERERALLIRLMSFSGSGAARAVAACEPVFGNLPTMLEATLSAPSVAPVSGNARLYLSLIPCLSRYRVLERMGEHPVLDRLEFAEQYVSALYTGARYEQVALLCLNENHQLIQCDMLSEGAFKEAPFYPRHMLKSALECGARSVILCHNHPSGRAHFSVADVAATKNAMRLFATTGIAMTDHLLVVGDRVKSMRAKLYLPEKLWMASASTAQPAGRWLEGSSQTRQ